MQNNSNNLFKKPSPIGRFFCLGVFLLFHTYAYAQPQLKFKDTKKSFGFVKKGEVIKVEFPFSNTGNEPLELYEAKAECSCTTVDFPKYPVKPNETDTITVYFDTKSVYDRQDRIIEVISNAKAPKQKIRFKGVVLQ